jgi:phosphoserine phosphatase
MSAEQATLALIFDFDDTIAPDTTTKLLTRNDIDAEQFWKEEFVSRIEDGYDPTVAYLSAIIDKTKNGELAGLSDEGLRETGQSLDSEVFTGFQSLLADIQDIVSEYDAVEIEFYVISEGLKTIIEATEIAAKLDHVYASEFSKTEGKVDGIKNAISFTDKTRYLFEINKGIDPTAEPTNPYAVNDRYEGSDRRIPFENMIYVGDGLTDVPCFSLIKGRGGRTIGVYDSEYSSPKQEAILEIGAPHRAEGSPPKYSEDEKLGSLIRLAVEGLCTDRTIDRLEAL